MTLPCEIFPDFALHILRLPLSTATQQMIYSIDLYMVLWENEYFLIIIIRAVILPQAVSVSTMLKTVTFEDGSSSTYNKLMIATGGEYVPHPLVAAALSPSH